MGRRSLDKIDPKELSRAAFEDGLETLRSGHIPANMSNIVCHIKDTTKELMEYAEAMTECALRQDKQIKLQQSIINAGKKAGVIAEERK